MTKLTIFEQAIEHILKHEGGYSNHRNDRGGETKYGISKASYPHLDIKNLTKDQAVSIYKQDFWEKYGYYQIQNPQIAIKIFDMAVNMGPEQAHRLLQRSIKKLGANIAIDGKLGKLTLAATNGLNPEQLLAALKSTAASYYQLLAQKPDQHKFLRGWLNRANA